MTEIPETKQTQKTKGWPPERRKAQADRVRQNRPWDRSTGPTSKSGKAISSRNGLKHGMRSENGKRLCKALRDHRQMIAVLEALSALTSIPPVNGQR